MGYFDELKNKAKKALADAQPFVELAKIELSTLKDDVTEATKVLKDDIVAATKPAVEETPAPKRKTSARKPKN